MTQQYLRKVGLVVSTGSQGLDLSQMRIEFHVYQADFDSPNTSIIRVYNLSADTAKTVEKEFQQVILQAGYVDGGYGVIFQGTIKQIKRGRLNATTTYLDIFGADGDTFYNFAVVNKTLAAGSSPKDQVDAIVQSAAKSGIEKGTIPNSLGSGGTLPRGKVLFGMARERMTDLATSKNLSWSIQNGKLVMIEATGYLPGEALVLSARTGMIGVPEATNAGIEVACLLNPFVKIGGRAQIDNASINTTQINAQGFPRYSDINFVASTAEDGMYRILVAEHHGDTHGDLWETALTCLAVDRSAAPGQSVKAAG